MANLSIQFPIEPTLDLGKLNAILNALKSALGPLGKQINEIDTRKLQEAFKDAQSEAKKLDQEVKDLDKTLERTSKSAAGIGTGLKSTLSNIAQYAGGTLLAGAITGGFGAIISGIQNVGKAMLGGAAEMETYKTQFVTLLHSTELAEQRLKELSKFAAETPFELPQIIEAEKVLVGFGLQGEKAMQMTGKSASELRTIIGDVAAGIGIPFEQLAVTIGRFSTGATGEAIQRMQELGIVTREELANMGVQFNNAGALVSSVPEALTAAVKIMQEKFGGGMKALSQTAEGQLSTLRDNINQMFRDLGTPLFEALKPVIGELNKIFSSEQFQNAIQTLGTALGNVANAVLPPIIQMITSLMPLITEIVNAITPIIVSLGKMLVPIVQMLANTLIPIISQIFKNLQPLFTVLIEIIGNILELLLPILTPILEILIPISKLLTDLLVPVLNVLMAILKPIIEVLKVLFSVITPVLTILIELIDYALKPLLELIEWVAEEVGKLTMFYINLYKSIYNTIVQIIDFIKNIKIVREIFQTLKHFVDEVINAIKYFADLLSGLLGLAGEASDEINKKQTEGVKKTTEATKEATSAVKENMEANKEDLKIMQEQNKELAKRPKKITTQITTTHKGITKKEEVPDITSDVERLRQANIKKAQEQIIAGILNEEEREKEKIRAEYNEKLETERKILTKILENEKIKKEQKEEYAKEFAIFETNLEKEKQGKIDEITKKYQDQRKQREIKATEEIERHKTELIEKELDERLRLQERLINFGVKATSEVFDRQYKAELKQLEELKEFKLISEEAYTRQREVLEETHQQRIQAIQAAGEGAISESQRQKELAFLKRRREELEAIREAMKGKEETEEYKKIEKQIEDLNTIIQEKGNILLGNAQTLSEGLTQIFANMFAGEEAVKNSARNLLAVIAGILKKQAIAAITQVLLNQISLASVGTGVASLLLIPAFTALITAAINAIIDPVIASLTSFATGGRVDKPTLIIAGDASRARPGSDTEWILRDDQIRTIIDDALIKYIQLDISTQEFKKLQLQKTFLDYLIKETNKVTENINLVKEIYKLTNSNLAKETYKQTEINKFFSSQNLKELFREIENINLIKETYKLIKVNKFLSLGSPKEFFKEIESINLIKQKFYVNNIAYEEYLKTVIKSKESIQEFNKLQLQKTFIDYIIKETNKINSFFNLFKSDFETHKFIKVNETITLDSLKELFREIENINIIEREFYTNNITYEEYLKTIFKSRQSLKDYIEFENLEGINRTIKPFIKTTIQTVSKAIEQATAYNVRIFERKIDELIKHIDQLDGRIYILENDIAEAVNHYNFKQRRRNIIK